MKTTGDDLRRAALARSICSRVCSDIRSEAELRRIDQLLTRIERDHLELPLKVYVAGASSEMDRATAAVLQLRAAGHELTSTWLDTVAKVGDANPSSASGEQRRSWSITDLAEVERADVLWFLVPSSGTTRGAWCEQGFSYALGKVIVCSGTNTTQSIFCALGEEFITDREALEHIGEIAKVRAKLVAMRESVRREISSSGTAADAMSVDGTTARRPQPDQPPPLRAKTITVPPMPSGKTVVLTVEELSDDGGEP